MANLGTLWFGADIDLSRLQQKIQQGNRSILEALKMNYDPQSYQQMVNRLRQELDRETFQIKVTTNVEGVRQNLQNALTGIQSTPGLANVNLGGLQGIPAMTRDLIELRDLIYSTKRAVSTLEKQWHNMQRIHGKDSAQATAARREYQAANDNLQNMMFRQHLLTIERQRAGLAQKELNRQTKEGTKAAKEMESVQAKLNASLGNGISISTRLGSAIGSIFAISAAKEFLNNVIEIGGQLEKQRISMGAIIGDTARANELFGKIKQLAIQSPFGVVELDQYSKQLAAFGIEQNELFDMTRRLADISAGAGQDIGRLALALGHVKSATYLTGITLRQFSMNNIPMLKMLAEYYSEVEKRAVSTAEVQKRISKRQVSYEDVVEQIKRMTNEGGMFYNMQEQISESLQARFKNLRDAFDIMYGEIAESKVGDALKEFALAATNLARNWKMVMTLLGSAAAVFGVWRASVVSANVAIVSQNRTLGIFARTTRAFTAEQVKELAVSNLISKSQLLNAVAAKRLTVEQAKLAAATFNVTEAQLQQIATSGKVSAGLYQNALATSRYSVAQLRTLATMRKANLEFTLFGKRITFLDRSMIRATATVKGLGVAFRTLWGWVVSAAAPVAVFAAISGIIALWQRHNQEVEQAKELNDDLYNRAVEGLKNVRQMMESTNMTLTLDGKDIGIDNLGRFKGEIEFPAASTLDDSQLRKSIETWTQFIKEYSVTPNLMLQAAYATDENGNAVHSLAEQYTLLGENVKIVSYSLPMLKTMSEALSNAINAADGGWFDDNLLKDMKDYENAFKAQRRIINGYVSQYRRAVDAAMEAARGNVVFSRAMEEAGVSASNTSEQLQFLINNQGKYYYAVEKFKKAFGSTENIGLEGLFDTGKLDSAAKNLETEMHQVAENLRTSLGGEFDLSKMTPEMVEAYGQAITRIFADTATKAGLSVDEVTKKVMELAQKEFPQIKLDIDEVKTVATISAIEEQLNNLVGEKFLIDIKTATNAFDVIQKIREGYKQAKDQIENAEPILVSLGLKADAMALMSDEAIEKYANGDAFVKQVLEGVREAQRKINHAVKSSEKYSFSLTDPTKGGKVFKDKDTKKETKQVDERIKQWREEQKELENFYKIYKRNAEYMSKNDAIQKALETGVFSDKTKLPKNIDDYLQVLKDFRDKVQKEMGKNPSEERKGFLSDLLMKIEEKEFDEKTKQVADKALKEMQEYISREAEKYNLYKSVFEKTGNVDLAGLAFTDGRLFDEAARKFEAMLKEVAGGIDIDYSMSDADAKEYFAGNKKAYELWKNIVDITRKNYVEALEKAATAQSEILTNSQKIAILNDKIAKAEADTTSGIDHSAEIQQWREEIEKLKSEMFEFLPIYEKIFGDKVYKGYSALKEAEEAARELISNANAGPTNPKTGKVSYYTSFYMDGNEIKRVTLTREQLERLKKTIDDFHKEEVAKNPFASLIKDIKNLYKELSDGDNDANAASESWLKFAESLSASADVIGSLAGQLSQMFDSLGNESMSQAMDDVATGMSSISNIAKGFAQGGLVGGIVATAGEAIGWVGRLAQAHDRKLDKAIQKSQLEVKRLENSYKKLEGAIDRALGGIYTTGGYKDMLTNLKKQRDELASQADNERKKKKGDESKILDYEQQLEELDEQIKYFAEDLAKSLYDIDVHSWADQLGDALFEAWKKGEDGAEAFREKAQEIIADVAKNIVVQKLIEKALEPVLNTVTEEMSRTGGQLDERSIEEISNAMALVGGTLPDAFNSLMNGLDAGLQRAGFDSLKDNGTKDSTLTNGIKSITEDTADLLASYVNAIRADVSMNRLVLEESLPAITVAVQRTNVIAEQQVAYQEQIAANTRANAEAAASIYDILHRVEIGAATLSVK